jgi:subtilisin family serine protease
VAFLAFGCSDREPVAPARSAAPPALQTSLGTLGSSDEPRLIVTFAGAEGSDFEGQVQALGGTVERRHSKIAVVTVTGVSAADASALAARRDVAAVDRDVRLQWIPSPEQMVQQLAGVEGPVVTPQGTDQSGAQLFGFQWNMQVIQAQAAWRATPAGGGRMICVLDNGVDPDHIELAGRIALDHSTSFVAAEPTIQDFNFHGTFVSSIVSSNGIRIASVASDARICAVKVLSTKGSGTFGDVIAGILFAADEGADVINMSLGARVDLTQPGVRGLVRVLQRAINVATEEGVVVVAAAGNGGLNLDLSPRTVLEVPAQLDHVISVGATAPFQQQNFDMLASYSNFGGRRGIKLVAPGGDLLTGGDPFDLVLGACSHTQVTLPFTCTKRTLLLGAGTSFASPHVAGAAAVVASELGGETRPARITGCILAGADPVGPSAIFGAGRLNVANAAACQGRGETQSRVAAR